MASPPPFGSGPPKKEAANPFLDAGAGGGGGGGGDDAHGHSHGDGGHGHSHGDQMEQLSLFVAARYGILARVKQILESGANIHERCDKGATVLHWAALNNNEEVALYLLDQGAEIDAPTSDTEQTPLHWAAVNGHLPMGKLLLERGADLMKVDRHGYSAFHHAVQYGKTLFVHFLTERNYPVDARDFEEHTGLHWAAFRGQVDTLKYLLDHGADIRAVDVNGCTALHWAALQGNMDCTKMLVIRGASLTETDSKDCTPEGCAQEKGHTVIANYLNLVARSSFEQEEDMEPATPSAHYVYMYLLPVVMVFGLYWTVATLPLAGVAGALLVGTAIGRTLSGSFLNNDTKDSLYIGCLHSFVVCTGHVYYVYLLPATYGAVVEPILVLGFTAVAAISYYKLWTTPPGFLELSDDPMAMYELAAQGISPTEFCDVCKSKKALRSVHCPTCKRCVSKFSHHCPFARTCVGQDNAIAAFMCTLFGLAAQLVFLKACSNFLFYDNDSPPYMELLNVFRYCYTFKAPVFIVFLVHCSYVPLSLRSVYLSVTSIKNGVTVYESVNAASLSYMIPVGHRTYRSMFDRGTSMNIKIFFGLAPDVDWKKQLDREMVLAEQGMNPAHMMQGGGHGHSHNGQPCHGHGQPTPQQLAQLQAMAASGQLGGHGGHGHSHGGNGGHGHSHG